MDKTVRTPVARRVNVFLPAGRSPDQTTALARQILSALRAHPVIGPAIERAGGQGEDGDRSPGDLVLQTEALEPQSESRPILNQFIGVLTVPLPPDIALDVLGSAIRSVPGAGDVGLDDARTFGIPSGEDPP